MTWGHIEGKNQPGNWLMCHNIPQAMGEDMLDIFVPHPGVIPGPGGPKMAKKQPKWPKNSQNDMAPY